MRLCVEQGQTEDARVFVDDRDGAVVVSVKEGLLSERAVQVLVLALGCLQAAQYVQSLN